MIAVRKNLNRKLMSLIPLEGENNGAMDTISKTLSIQAKLVPQLFKTEQA
jgi:hypothetical protein